MHGLPFLFRLLEKANGFTGTLSSEGGLYDAEHPFLLELVTLVLQDARDDNGFLTLGGECEMGGAVEGGGVRGAFGVGGLESEEVLPVLFEVLDFLEIVFEGVELGGAEGGKTSHLN